jgi:antirestriction protein ArdC
MSRSAACARTGRDRPSLYQEITDKIIAELEAGRVPWVQPWGSVAAKASLAVPKNAATQRHYSGINVLILWGAVIEHGFSTQNWLTFRQALGLGGNVRKGEHGTTVVYADRFVPDEERRRAERDGDEPSAIPFLKRFTVFNTDQCENLPPELTSTPAPLPDGLILPHAEALISATGIEFRIGGERAFYSPIHDFIQVPRPEAYFEPINWHRTALHELAHASGHATPPQPRSLRQLRIQKIRLRRNRGDNQRIHVRVAWHRSDGAPRRLYRVMAREMASWRFLQ